MSSQFLRWTCLAICCQWMTGCFSLPTNVGNNWSFSENPAMGLLVASLTYSGLCEVSNFIQLENQAHTEQLLISFATQPDWLPSNDCVSEMPQPAGRLMVVALQPGDYAITGYLSRLKSISIAPDETSPIMVSIKRKAITYIGNIHLHISDLDIRRVIVDQSKRDMDLFLSKYPELAHESVLQNVSDAQRITWQIGERNPGGFRMPRSIFTGY